MDGLSNHLAVKVVVIFFMYRCHVIYKYSDCNRANACRYFPPCIGLVVVAIVVDENMTSTTAPQNTYGWDFLYSITRD